MTVVVWSPAWTATRASSPAARKSSSTPSRSAVSTKTSSPTGKCSPPLLCSHNALHRDYVYSPGESGHSLPFTLISLFFHVAAHNFSEMTLDALSEEPRPEANYWTTALLDFFAGSMSRWKDAGTGSLPMEFLVNHHNQKSKTICRIGLGFSNHRYTIFRVSFGLFNKGQSSTWPRRIMYKKIHFFTLLVIFFFSQIVRRLNNI